MEDEQHLLNTEEQFFARRERNLQPRDHTDDDDDQSLERVRDSLLQHLWTQFDVGDELASSRKKTTSSESAAQRRRRRSSRPLSHGFNSMLESFRGRSHEGYARLDAEPPPIQSRKIVLDPHTPLTWTSKGHFIQSPSTYDALDGLLASDEGIIERRIVAKGPGRPPDSKNDLNDGQDSSNAQKKKEEGPDDKRKKTECQPNMKFVGIFLAAVSGVFFTLCSVTVKLLPRIDPAEVLLFRALTQMVLIVPIMAVARANPLGPKGVRFIVYLQGVIGCLTVTCIFIGFARLPVGDAATIIFCSPIFVMIFSHVILREHCGFFRVWVILLLMFGVVLIAKPPFLIHAIFKHDNIFNLQQQNDYDVLGYGAALCGTMLTASNFVCMRKLRDVHFSVLIFAFSVMSAVMSAGMVAVMSEFKLPQTGEEWLYSVLVGVFGLLGQCLLAVALKFETAGVVSVTRSMDIAVAYVIQITWFGDIPLWTSILGAFVVIIAVFTMAMEDAFLALLTTTCGGTGWC